MSFCQTGDKGMHRLEWIATFEGKGYWVCMNALCGEVEFAYEEHQGVVAIATERG